MHVAFSRQQAEKVYVQHLLSQYAADVVSWLRDEEGYFYICGDARMAREVQATLCQILSQTESISVAEAEVFVRNLKSSGRFQVGASPRIFPVLISMRLH